MKCIQPRLKCRRPCHRSGPECQPGAGESCLAVRCVCVCVCVCEANNWMTGCGALMPCLHLFSTVRACAILINMQIQLKMPIYAWHNIPRKNESTNSKQIQIQIQNAAHSARHNYVDNNRQKRSVGHWIRGWFHSTFGFITILFVHKSNQQIHPRTQCSFGTTI